MPEIKLAKSAGFCFGVSRAVEKAYEVARSGKDADSVFDFEPAGTLCADAQIADGIPCQLKIKFTDRSGEDFYLVDYASAGRDWETVIAAWLRTK